MKNLKIRKPSKTERKARAKVSRLKKIDETLLDKELQIEFAAFLQHFPPKEFSRHLRQMVLDYMEVQLGGVSNYTDRLLIALGSFFNVLDIAEDKWQKVDLMEIWKYRDYENM
jgi:hypothetical protein